MNTKIQIASSLWSLRDLMRELNAYQAEAPEYTLRYEKVSSRYRGVDTGVLIALVGLAGTGLGALITGLFNIAAQRHGAYVELSSKDWSVRVPAGMPSDERDRLIEQAKTQNIKKIEIIGGDV